MNIAQKIVILVIALLMLQSCYNDIDLEKYRNESAMVLNSVVSSDTVVMAFLTETIFYTDVRNPKSIIADADMRLFVNDKFKEHMVWTDDSTMPSGVYKSLYRPKCGDEIKVEADFNGKTVWATDRLIEKVNIMSVDLVLKLSDQPTGTIYIQENGTVVKKDLYDQIYTYKVKFVDPKDQQNYYCIRIEDESGRTIGERMDFSSDPIFLLQQDEFGSLSSDGRIYSAGGRVFSDELIDGMEYTLSVGEYLSMPYKDNDEPMIRRVVLYSLSEAYYKYLLTTLNARADDSLEGKLESIGFAESSKCYSNINGGVGIFGAVEKSVVICNLRDASI